MFFALFCTFYDGKRPKKLISTSERCVEHLFAGQNTQKSRHLILEITKREPGLCNSLKVFIHIKEIIIAITMRSCSNIE